MIVAPIDRYTNIMCIPYTPYRFTGLSRLHLAGLINFKPRRTLHTPFYGSYRALAFGQLLLSSYPSLNPRQVYQCAREYPQSDW